MAEKNNNQVKTISAVMIITLAGKLLGLLRDRLLAVNYGSGMYANAFLTASRIPRVFFDIVFASAISASFIPVFSEVFSRKGKKEAMIFAGNFVTVVGLLTFALSMLGIIFAEPMVHLFADGYDAETTALCAALTRIIFPTVFFTGIAYSFVGILQATDEFNIPAFISVLSNLVLIAYYILLNDRFGVYGLAIAFLAGWSLQAIVQIPALRKKGFRYKPSFSIRNNEMKKVLLMMLPVMVSTWVQPINLVINTRFASHLNGGSGVSAIEYSTNLYLIIIGVFVLSITNVIFPKLSRLEVSDDKEGFGSTLRTTMHGSLFFVIPMMAGVMSLSTELVDLIYGGGEFGEKDTAVTSTALFFISLGMAGYTVQNILSRVYFAKMNGIAPLAAGVVSIVANIVLCVLLVDDFGVAGLAVASAVSSTVNAVVLMIPLERKKEGFISAGFIADMLKVTLISCIMAAAVKFTAQALAAVFTGMVKKFVVLFVPAFIGVVLFFALAAVLRLPEAKIISDMAKKLTRRFHRD